MELALGKIKFLSDTKIVDKMKDIKSIIGGRKWELTKFIKKLIEEAEDIEKVRVELVKKYGETVDDKVSVSSEKMGLFMEEFNQVLAKKVELPDFKFKSDELDSFSVDDLLTIGEEFIEE
jgi:hypothetical protein